MENHIIQEKQQRIKRENVLLLSMSTLPLGKPQNYHYQKVDADWTYDFEGCTQMENGTKYILAKLSREKKRLNRIVIMASQKSMESLSDNEKEMWNTSSSALEIYKSRVTDYINQTPYQIRGEQAEDGPIKETKIEKSITYSMEDLESLFQVVKIDEANQSINLWNVVQTIKGEQREEKQIDLYLDMQGGSQFHCTDQCSCTVA